MKWPPIACAVMPQARKKLYLVDAKSQVYRAFYAVRHLSTSTGIPTNAIFGFTNILRKLIKEEKPDYLGVIDDAPEPTFRHEAFEQYKAKRLAMPDDLVPQLAYIDQVCGVLRCPVIKAAGFEADDIIGTLAHKAVEAELDVMIVTNDKDMGQLVNEHVRMLRTDRSNVTSILDAAGVEERYGVRPDQMVDLLGLWGDTIDNIPGAPGIGEKGAKQIIQEFGSIDAAMAGAEKISRKSYRESLLNNTDIILQSRELARIRTDVPIDLNLDALILEEPDRGAAYRLFSELEFAQLKKEFEDAASEGEGATASEAAQSAEYSYSLITTNAELKKFIDALWEKDSFGLAACERDGRLESVAISSEPGAAALIDFTQVDSPTDAIHQIRALLENGLISKSIHDLKGALTALNRFGGAGASSATQSDGSIVEFKPSITVNSINADTLLASYLLDPNRANYQITDMAREHLRYEFRDSVEGCDAAGAKTVQAAEVTARLAPVLDARIKEAGLEYVYREIELPLVHILFEMEQTGVLIDVMKLREAGLEMEQELMQLTARIYELAGEGFNINSTVQLGEIFERLNFEVGRKTKTGRISTSADVLEELAAKYELPRLIIEYREIAKLKNTYVDALPKLINPRTGRLHTTLNQAVAATGRLSSTNPNLQNIPIRSEMGRKIRAAFVACPGRVLMSADYSQIELRIFAHITGDPVMTEAFIQGDDIHARTARAVFGAKTKEQEAEFRRVAKIVNFAIAYDIGPFGLAQRTGLSRAEAKAAIENYYQTYTGVRRYMEQTPEEVRKNGVVRTIFGRSRPIPDINNKNYNLRARAEREAINAPIQGTAADLVKIAMIHVHNRLRRERLSARMTLQVHDELLLEVPEAEVERTTQVVREEMEGVHVMDVPLVVDVHVGKNWMQAKP